MRVAVVGAGIVGAATARALAARGVAVDLLDAGEVSGGTTGLGEGDVLCSDKDAGAWSAGLARGVGLELPVEPRKGQLVRLGAGNMTVRHKVFDGGYLAAVEARDAGLQVSTVLETTWDGDVLVGSSRERRGFDTSVDTAVTEALLAHAARLIPGVARLEVEDAWAGLRPWLPDGLPALGPSRVVPGLWVATGHEGAGVGLGPISGESVAAAMCGERPAVDLTPFDPDRFLPGRAVRAATAHRRPATGG
jgi:glycine/D-amino acid oxidase-like deaminating enzyme